MSFFGAFPESETCSLLNISTFPFRIATKTTRYYKDVFPPIHLFPLHPNPPIENVKTTIILLPSPSKKHFQGRFMPKGSCMARGCRLGGWELWKGVERG